MRRNVKGSTLVWAIILIMVIMVTVASALTISFAYYNRSLVIISQRQAYISAKSITKNMVEEILVKNDEYLAFIPKLEGGESNKITISSFPNNMGTVDFIDFSTTMTKEEGGVSVYTLSISTKVTYNDKSDIVSADLKKVNPTADWQLLKYYRGEKEENVNVAHATKMINVTASLAEMAASPDRSEKEIKRFITTEYEAEVKKARAVLGEKWGTTWMMGNDIFRQLYFYGFYDGKWPKFDNSQSLVEISGDYYIQPFFAEGEFSNFVIFANQNESVERKNWNANLIFYQGHWYYNKKNFLLTNLTGTGQSESWKLLEAWIASAQKCD